MKLSDFINKKYFSLVLVFGVLTSFDTLVSMKKDGFHQKKFVFL
ncbi:hypothetical protein ACVRXX_05265 [Streptococcus plurextorum]